SSTGSVSANSVAATARGEITIKLPARTRCMVPPLFIFCLATAGSAWRGESECPLRREFNRQVCEVPRISAREGKVCKETQECFNGKEYGETAQVCRFRALQ